MPKKEIKHGRLILLQCLFSLAVIAIIFRLFYIQVIRHKEYEAKAQNQHWNFSILSARRGDILAKDGFPLATSKTYFTLFAKPRYIDDPTKYAKLLADRLKTEKDKETLENEFKSMLSQDLYWVSLYRRIPEEKKHELEELKLENIGFEEEPMRYYPEGLLASHVMGFVAGGDKDQAQGYFGLEGYFNGDLRGKPGRILEERSAGGESIILGGYKKIPPLDGRSLFLTIDRGIQFLVEEKLKEGVLKYQAKSGSVLIINPVNGEIYAMANYPTYNPDMLDGEGEESTESLKIERKNVSISDVYEPGSVIKPLTVAAAIDLGLVSPETTFNDDGPKTYSEYTIDNWNGKHLGVLNIKELLEKSNNIGAAWVGTKVGAGKLYQYFRKFGLGELTGITLEGENTGVLRDPSKWAEIDLATAAFGQGISASVLQLAVAFSAFDNGGYLVKPKIVTKIYDVNREIDFPNEKKWRVISSKTAQTVAGMLVDAVDKGEAKFFNIKGYTVAGKTGTAQIPVDGKYDPNKTNATFVGFLPYAPFDKKLVMVVKLEEPTASIYAAETAVPLWMDIIEDVVVSYRIPPDRPY